MPAIYPFTAIVGQERMRRALILNAVDTRIGGVLIRGERRHREIHCGARAGCITAASQSGGGLPLRMRSDKPGTWCTNARTFCSEP